ncbi:MAG: 2-C-methyl-D-erythritol 4-phosphate cytidylyltransferase [Bacteroidales bacterium]|nr:2-C-methyl-D-erythritol 4-phosphate cytidylyltransferase [Bacteroidales bacterium]
MERHVIIVAGGKGKRFQSEIPKQFIKLLDECVVMHSIRAFYDCIPEIKIILALPEPYFELWQQLCDECDFSVPHTLSRGGETRFQSVKNGLEYVDEEGLIAVHDGVRPVVSAKLILNSFSEAEKFGNAIPGISVNDSVRIFENGDYKVVDREQLKLIQTPQCFKSSILKKAYQQEYNKSFTDDASVVESFGEQIHLIEGDIDNIKITRDVDLMIAKNLLNQ